MIRLTVFGKEYVNQIIDELKNQTYEPKAVKRVYIPKRNGKTASIRYSVIQRQTDTGCDTADT